MKIINLDERRSLKDPEAEYVQPQGERSVGRFVRQTTNDARGRARDGAEVYEVRSVPMGDPDSEVVEVRFADGEWLLIDASEVQADDAGADGRPSRHD